MARLSFPAKWPTTPTCLFPRQTFLFPLDVSPPDVFLSDISPARFRRFRTFPLPGLQCDLEYKKHNTVPAYTKKNNSEQFLLVLYDYYYYYETSIDTD